MNNKFISFAKLCYNNSVIPRIGLNIRPFSYKSSLSLDKIYPNSSLKIVTPEFKPTDPEKIFSGYIPINKLEITYSCSSGPGGQHVNKTHTKVDLRFKVNEADWLDQSIRDRLIKENANKLSKEGYMIIKSDLTRSQQLNLADCMKKLRDLIRGTPTKEPSHKKLEELRKGREKANRIRLMTKRTISEKREFSKPPTVHDL